MPQSVPTVIAIDDNELVLTQLELIISNQTTCQFVGFNNFTEALQSNLLHEAFLILLDMNMP